MKLRLPNLILRLRTSIVCRPSHMPTLSVEKVETSEALQELRANWKILSEDSKHRNVFTTFEWFSAWNQRAAGASDGHSRFPMILVLKSNDRTIAISPLIRRRVSKLGVVVRKIEFLESPADYNDLLLGDDQPENIESILEHLEDRKDDWDIVDLRSLRDSGDTLSRLQNALAKSDLLYRILPEARCPYLPIDCDTSEIIRGFPRSARRTVRNQQHRLDRMKSEGLRIRIIEHPEAEPLLLEKFISIEKLKRVEGKPIPPLFADAPHVFQSLLDSLGPKGWLYAALMELNDDVIAFQFGFRCGHSLWDYSKAYDPKFSRLSPGTMLIPAVLDYGYANGYREYDFLRGEEQYKMRWSTGFHRTWRVVIWNQRHISRIRAFLYLNVKSAVNRASYF
jgi:CelD/BcsL family acetyltransferase involved in cellulose biosynthesis